MGLLSAKPIIYACNMDEDGVAAPEGNNVLRHCQGPVPPAGGRGGHARSAPRPRRIMAETGRRGYAVMFLEELGVTSHGLDRLIRASYSLLGLISFLTDGKKECRAWTITQGHQGPSGRRQDPLRLRARALSGPRSSPTTRWPSAAFDYAAVKAKGAQRTEGKDYVGQRRRHHRVPVQRLR